MHDEYATNLDALNSRKNFFKARDRYSNKDCRRKTAIELPEKKLGRSTFGFSASRKSRGNGA